MKIWGTMVDTAADDPVAAVESYRHTHGNFQAVAGYVGPRAGDNRFVTFPQLVHHYGHRKRCLSIGVHMEYPAVVGDFEAGDMGVSEVKEWHRRRISEGFWRPVLYCSLSQFDELHAQLKDVNKFTYRTWVADYRTDLGFEGSLRNAVKLLRNEYFGAVQFWATDPWDVSLVRRDFWPAVR